MIKNLTPHTVTVCGNNNEVYAFKPEPVSARIVTTEESVTKIGHFNVTEKKKSRIVGLPPEDDETLYIVSAVVRITAGATRNDLIVPYHYSDRTGMCQGFWK
jgi:hypothetical protein